MRAALLTLLPVLLLVVSPSSTLADKRKVFTSDRVRRANDSTLPSKAQVRASKTGCVLKFYPLNPKEPWPTTASPNHTYRLAFELINRNKTEGSDYKGVWLGLQKPAGATFKLNSFQAKPALPNATFVPVVPLFLWGPFNVPPRSRQYIEFAYTLPVCSPGIAWNVTVNNNPFRNGAKPRLSFQRIPPFTGPCGVGYAYRVRGKKSEGGRKGREGKGRFLFISNSFLTLGQFQKR